MDSLSSPGIQLQVFTSLAVTSTPATSATVGQPIPTRCKPMPPAAIRSPSRPARLAQRHGPMTLTRDADLHLDALVRSGGRDQSFTYTVADAGGQQHAASNGECHGVGASLTVTSTPATTATVGAQYTYQVTDLPPAAIRLPWPPRRAPPCPPACKSRGRPSPGRPDRSGRHYTVVHLDGHRHHPGAMGTLARCLSRSRRRAALPCSCRRRTSRSVRRFSLPSTTRMREPDLHGHHVRQQRSHGAT